MAGMQSCQLLFSGAYILSYASFQNNYANVGNTFCLYTLLGHQDHYLLGRRRSSATNESVRRWLNFSSQSVSIRVNRWWCLLFCWKHCRSHNSSINLRSPAFSCAHRTCKRYENRESKILYDIYTLLRTSWRRGNTWPNKFPFRKK